MPSPILESECPIVRDPASQLEGLTAAGCERIFTDTASGRLELRPQLDQLLEVVVPGDGVVVWRLDRVGRSLRHLVGFLAELGERGVEFQSLTEAIDTTTVTGQALFNIMGSLAEFERCLNVERTQAGLEAARVRGRKGGRPRKVDEAMTVLIQQLYDSREHSVDEIARMVGIGRTTVYRSIDLASRRSGHERTPLPDRAR
jgi:DNA invertase Pin-like site-specific DNA recombinase